MPFGQDRSGLKLFIGRGERFGLQVPITRLLNHIGHCHEGVGIFPRVLHLGAQGPNMVFDQPMIFPCFPFLLSGSDQSFGKQRQNGLEDLLAAGLRPQDSAGLFHLAALLPTPMLTPMQQMFFHLFPGWAASICSKHIELRPQIGDDLIDRNRACIASGKRIGNESVWVFATSLLLCDKDLLCAVYERFVFPHGCPK
jgi:hypothetical protein